MSLKTVLRIDIALILLSCLCCIPEIISDECNICIYQVCAPVIKRRSTLEQQRLHVKCQCVYVGCCSILNLKFCSLHIVVLRNGVCYAPVHGKHT